MLDARVGHGLPAAVSEQTVEPPAGGLEIAQIGLVGLAVMGRNLALNIADNGFRIAVYNRSPAATNEGSLSALDKLYEQKKHQQKQQNYVK